MATMTPEDRTETIKAAFEMGDLNEEYRIKAGVRAPHQWKKKVTTLSGRHANVPCRGCFKQIRRGEQVVWEEDWSCYIAARRHRFWHRECHPDWINREFERLRRNVARHGWSSQPAQP